MECNYLGGSSAAKSLGRRLMEPRSSSVQAAGPGRAPIYCSAKYKHRPLPPFVSATPACYPQPVHDRFHPSRLNISCLTPFWSPYHHLHLIRYSHSPRLIQDSSNYSRSNKCLGCECAVERSCGQRQYCKGKYCVRNGRTFSHTHIVTGAAPKRVDGISRLQRPCTRA